MWPPLHVPERLSRFERELPGIDDSAVLDRHRTAMRSGVLEALSVMVPPACAPRSVP